MTTATVPDTLYALAPQYAILLRELEASGGDVTDEEFAAHFDAIQQGFGEKIEACMLVARHQMADAKALTEFARPFIERAARLEKEAERIKRYAMGCMIVANQIRIETPLGGARIQLNPVSVKVDCDPATLPIEFTRTVVEPDKKMLAEQHRLGLPLPEGVSVERTKRLVWL